MDESDSISALSQLMKHKTRRRTDAVALGPSMVSFFKREIQKKQPKLEAVAAAWTALVPPMLAEHTCLDGFRAGVLTVLVDSSAHLYELKTLFLAGLEKQLVMACRSAGLKKLRLKPGRWYDGDGPTATPKF